MSYQSTKAYLLGRKHEMDSIIEELQDAIDRAQDEGAYITRRILEGVIAQIEATAWIRMLDTQDCEL